MVANIPAAKVSSLDLGAKTVAITTISEDQLCQEMIVHKGSKKSSVTVLNSSVADDGSTLDILLIADLSGSNMDFYETAEEETREVLDNIQPLVNIKTEANEEVTETENEVGMAENEEEMAEKEEEMADEEMIDHLYSDRTCPGRKRKRKQIKCVKSYECDIPGCFKEYSQLCQLNQHRTTHSKAERRKFKCTYQDCIRAFACDRSLQRHLILHVTAKRGCQCSGCQHPNYKNWDVKPKMITCPFCQKIYDLKPIVDGPMHSQYFQTLEESLLIKCLDCGQKNVVKISDKVGEQSCPEPMFLCSQTDCQSFFYDLKSLLLHLTKIHQKQCICELCGREFAHPRFLKKHRVLFHSKKANLNSDDGQQTQDILVRKHICEFCGAAYVALGKLREHYLLKHQGEQGVRKGKTYSCPICNKHFTLRRYVVQHLKRTHSEGSAKCKNCGQIFESHDDLNNHISAEGCYSKLRSTKLYKCPACQEDFYKLTDMQLHRNRQHQDLTIACDLCENRYFSQYNLSRHKERVHNIPRLPRIRSKKHQVVVKSEITIIE